jgi:hypothetical protein
MNASVVLTGLDVIASSIPGLRPGLCCLAPLGMRVKLRALALKARNSRAQGASPGNGHRYRNSPEGAAQVFAAYSQSEKIKNS